MCVGGGEGRGFGTKGLGGRLVVWTIDKRFLLGKFKCPYFSEKIWETKKIHAHRNYWSDFVVAVN